MGRHPSMRSAIKPRSRRGASITFLSQSVTLAVAALEADWKAQRAQLDTIFSPTVPPLERLRLYFEFSLEHLQKIKEECGAVLGCPLNALGSEVCTQDTALRAKIQEILDRKLTYFESAIRDAHAEGLIVAPDAKAKAKDAFYVHPGGPHSSPHPK